MAPLLRRSAGELRVLLSIFGVLGGVMLSILLLLACLHIPNILPALWNLPWLRHKFSGLPPARLVLEGCQFWYLMLMLLCALVVLATLSVALWSLRRVLRGNLQSLQSFLAMLVMPGLVVFVCVAMLTTEQVPSLFLQTVEDLRQMEEGRTEEAVVWLSPKTRSGRLPGPYTEGQPEPLIHYGAIGPATDWGWETFSFPETLHFTLDDQRLFDENRSIPWNEEHAQWYRLTYTTNFHLVVSAEPVPGPADLS